MAIDVAIKQASLPALDHTARYLLLSAESVERSHKETAMLFRAFREMVDEERDVRIEREAHRRRADHDRG